jgi:hypothetical protein
MTIGSRAGVTFSGSDGINDASFTMKGTLSALNAAMEGLRFIPPASYAGTATLTIQSNDLGNTGAGGSQTDSDTVTINVVNRAPVAAPDTYSTPLNTKLVVAAPGVLRNDYDVDRDVITALLVAKPKAGNISLSTNGSFVYTPKAGYVGQDSFTYQAKDAHGALSNIVTVTLKVGTTGAMGYTAPAASASLQTFAEVFNTQQLITMDELAK